MHKGLYNCRTVKLSYENKLYIQFVELFLISVNYKTDQKLQDIMNKFEDIDSKHVAILLMLINMHKILKSNDYKDTLQYVKKQVKNTE